MNIGIIFLTLVILQQFKDKIKMVFDKYFFVYVRNEKNIQTWLNSCTLFSIFATYITREIGITLDNIHFYYYFRHANFFLHRLLSQKTNYNNDKILPSQFCVFYLMICHKFSEINTRNVFNLLYLVYLRIKQRSKHFIVKYILVCGIP